MWERDRNNEIALRHGAEWRRGVFAFGHGDFRDIPVKLNNSSGAPDPDLCSTGWNEYNEYNPKMFDFRRLFGVSYCITHNLLGIHDWMHCAIL